MEITSQFEYERAIKEKNYYERKLLEGQQLIESEILRKIEIESALNTWNINND